MWNAIRWIILVPVSVVLIIILSWCLLFTFQEEMQNRKRLIYIDIKAKQEELPRMQAKRNLNMVIETNTKRKNNNDLFDKLWYLRREDS
jgi:hypothetical protein